MRCCLPALFLLLSCPAAPGYSAPPPVSFAKPTPDGRFVLVMLTPSYEEKYASPQEKALRRKYPGGGLYTKDDESRLLWAADWYGDNVHPASDGVHAARVNDIRGDWLGRQPRRSKLAQIGRYEALRLYAEGQLFATYTLGELFDTSLFTQEQLNTWFCWLSKAELDEAAGTIVMEAVTGERVAVDYRTGKVVSRSGGGRWAVALAIGAGVVAAGTVVVLALAALLVRRVRVAAGGPGKGLILR